MITALEQTTIKDEKHENRVNERNNGVGNVQQVTKRMSVYPPAPFFPTQKHPIFLRIFRPPKIQMPMASAGTFVVGLGNSKAVGAQ